MGDIDLGARSTRLSRLGTRFSRNISRVHCTSSLPIPFVHFSQERRGRIVARQANYAQKIHIVAHLPRELHTRHVNRVVALSPLRNESTSDRPRFLEPNNPNAGQYLNCGRLRTRNTFYTLYSGGTAREWGTGGGQSQRGPLRAPPAVGCAVIFFRGRPTAVGGRGICIVKFPCASAHMCTVIRARVYVRIRSSSDRSPSFPDRAAPFFPMRKGADGPLAEAWLCTVSSHGFVVHFITPLSLFIRLTIFVLVFILLIFAEFYDDKESHDLSLDRSTIITAL